MAYNLIKGTWFKEACDEQGYIVFDPKYIKEAEKYGIQFGTGDFIVYQYLRWCEDSGKYHIMIAGYEHIKERFGFEKAKDVTNILDHLSRLGAVNHIWCDTKIYRSKTKIWVSTERLKSTDPSVNLTDPSVNLTDPSVNLTDPSVNLTDPSVNATPVLTPIRNNNIKEKRENADSPDGSSAPSPFFSPVSNNEKDVGRQADNKKEFALCAELLALMGLSNIKAGVKLRNSVRARLRDGYSELDLRAIARWSATQQDEFYKVPHSLFSEAGTAGAMSLMKKAKNGTTYSTR